MKILKNLKLFIFAAVAAVSLVTVRVIQLVFLTESRTGFYLEGTAELAIGLTAFITVIIAIGFCMGLFADKKDISTTPNTSIPLGAAALLTGFSHIAEPFLYKSAFAEAIPSLLIIARLVVLVGAGLIFVYIGYSLLFGKKIRFEVSVLLVVALIVRLMSTFVSYSGMSNISENTIDVVMLVSTLAFFHFQGKALCGIKNSRTVPLIFGFGMVAVLSSFLSALPGVIVSLFSTVKVIHAPVDSPVTTLFTAIYIIV